MASLSNADELLEEYWKMLAYAGRYGHQPVLQMIGPLTVERISAFGDAVQFWMDKEGKKGDGGMSEYMATGGG